MDEEHDLELITERRRTRRSRRARNDARGKMLLIISKLKVRKQLKSLTQARTT